MYSLLGPHIIIKILSSLIDSLVCFILCVFRVFKILHQLLTTTDSNLFEKVKLALQQLTM